MSDTKNVGVVAVNPAAGDPLADLLKFVRGEGPIKHSGGITSHPQATDDQNQQNIHAAMLELERRGQVVRHHVAESGSVTWVATRVVQGSIAPITGATAILEKLMQAQQPVDWSDGKPGQDGWYAVIAGWGENEEGVFPMADRLVNGQWQRHPRAVAMFAGPFDARVQAEEWAKAHNQDRYYYRPDEQAALAARPMPPLQFNRILDAGELVAERDRLRAALEFYADPKNYKGRVVNDGGGHYDRMGFEVEEDAGAIARKALDR